MKRSRLAVWARIAACAALVTVSLAATTDARDRLVEARNTVRRDAPRKDLAMKLARQVADRRPMKLTVTLPGGEVLQPDAPIFTSTSLKAASAGAPETDDRLAQFEPTVLLDRSGELTDDDEILESDNSRFDVYLIEGTTNQNLTVSIASSAFDTFLMLLDGDGNTIAQNDDISPSNTNSIVEVVLPSSGTYLVVVNGLNSSSRGAYRVTASAPAGAPAAPNVTRFTCNGAANCSVSEGASDYLSFSYTDPNGNASAWTLNDFTAEVYPVSGGGTIQPGIDCTCPTGVGDCNTSATDTYTVSMQDTSGRTSNSRSVTVTCSP
ncbi:MAG: PPC domain-containing protein [Geitlerinemataceae cyanobacterium]